MQIVAYSLFDVIVQLRVWDGPRVGNVSLCKVIGNESEKVFICWIYATRVSLEHAYNSLTYLSDIREICFMRQLRAHLVKLEEPMHPT
jgi:hypothetical protein